MLQEYAGPAVSEGASLSSAYLSFNARILELFKSSHALAYHSSVQRGKLSLRRGLEGGVWTFSRLRDHYLAESL